MPPAVPSLLSSPFKFTPHPLPGSPPNPPTGTIYHATDGRVGGWMYCFGHSLGLFLPNSVWFYEKKRPNKHYFKIIVLAVVPGGRGGEMARGGGMGADIEGPTKQPCYEQVAATSQLSLW